MFPFLVLVEEVDVQEFLVKRVFAFPFLQRQEDCFIMQEVRNSSRADGQIFLLIFLFKTDQLKVVSVIEAFIAFAPVEVPEVLGETGVVFDDLDVVVGSGLRASPRHLDAFAVLALARDCFGLLQIGPSESV